MKLERKMNKYNTSFQIHNLNVSAVHVFDLVCQIDQIGCRIELWKFRIVDSPSQLHCALSYTVI